MVANKKSRLRKKFNYNADRTKVIRKHKKLPIITCDAIRKNWKKKLSAPKNLESMGLVAETNKALPVVVEDTRSKKQQPTEVVKELIQEANKPRTGTMRIPKEKVRMIEYFVDKYGDDYEAMVRDKNNHYQETAAQLRQKIKQYMKRPAYAVPFLKARGKLTTQAVKAVEKNEEINQNK